MHAAHGSAAFRQGVIDLRNGPKEACSCNFISAKESAEEPARIFDFSPLYDVESLQTCILNGKPSHESANLFER